MCTNFNKETQEIWKKSQYYSSISHIKNPVESLTNRLGQGEERILGLEDKADELSQTVIRNYEHNI
jgi:hypothetical protein